MTASSDNSTGPQRYEWETVAVRRPKPGLFKLVVVVVMACVLSSGATVGLLLATDVIDNSEAATAVETREKVVLQEGEIVADIFDQVSPSTVAITTSAVSDRSSYFSSGYIEGAGSGVIISDDGYVLTNKHVVPQGARQVTVTTADGKEYEDVTIVGRDPINDIAFLKINNVKDLPAATLGDSAKVKPGQKVIAIGNALGEFRNSITSGIISGLGRPVTAAAESGQDAETLENLFQTDAAINPGNSGGPLVSYTGEVIGINTAIAEDAQGIGFAIPVNDIKGMIAGVLEKGAIVRPYLGVRYVGLNKGIQEQLKLSTSEGAYVLGDGRGLAVVAGSPADKAGLQEGDIITAVDDQKIDEDHSLASRLAQHAPDDKITLTVLRDDKEQAIVVTLEGYPAE